MLRLAIICGLIVLTGFWAHEMLYPASSNPLRRHVEECPVCQCAEAPVWSCVTGATAADY